MNMTDPISAGTFAVLALCWPLLSQMLAQSLLAKLQARKAAKQWSRS